MGRSKGVDPRKNTLHIYVSDGELEEIRHYAENVYGLHMSAWARMILLQVIRGENRGE